MISKTIMSRLQRQSHGTLENIYARRAAMSITDGNNNKSRETFRL